MAKAAGCAAKLNPATLDAVLRKLPRQTDPNVLVGFDTNDDAGIYLLGEGLALVQTVDFFTPIVDDPQLFGQIAAANALSDVYAMGGRPISALSIVGFPEKSDPEILEQIIRGGLAKMNEAKCSVIGGHSIRNEDMLFGYAVTGVINPHRIWRNVGARAGDVLLFTKPLGTGVITTALKKDRATAESLPGAVEAAREGHLSGGLKNNRAFIGDCVAFDASVPSEYQDLLFDPQTSGGLLISISPESAEAALSALQHHGVSARRVGKVVAKKHPLLFVH